MKKLLVSAVCVFAIVAVVVLARGSLLSPPSGSEKVESPTTTEVKQANAVSGGNMSMNALEDSFRQGYTEWEARQQRFSSSVEARRRVNFDFKLPDASSVPKLRSLYLNPEMSPEKIMAKFGDPVDGIYFSAELVPVTDEAAARSGYQNHLKENAPYSGPSKPVLLEIDGHPGYGEGPLKYEEDEELFTPAFVEWRVGAVNYVLTGSRGQNPTSLEQLVAIAKTVR